MGTTRDQIHALAADEGWTVEVIHAHATAFVMGADLEMWVEWSKTGSVMNANRVFVDRTQPGAGGKLYNFVRPRDKGKATKVRALLVDERAIAARDAGTPTQDSGADAEQAPDAYWLVTVDRRTGATTTRLYEGLSAADDAHAEADRVTSSAAQAVVIGRRTEGN